MAARLRFAGRLALIAAVIVTFQPGLPTAVALLLLLPWALASVLAPVPARKRGR